MVLTQSRTGGETGFLGRLKARVAHRSRGARAKLFMDTFRPTDKDSILDLGGGKGHHFARYFPLRKNVWISDLFQENLDYAARVYGFQTRLSDGAQVLPFEDGEYDIVFCNSVIEHITGPRLDAIALFKSDSGEFRRSAFEYQKQFADEIRRVGKRYFVQTPNKHYPVESHSWIPFLGYLPSGSQWRIIRVFNRFWPRKHTEPEWNLLTYGDMKALFPDAHIYRERYGLFVKSLIAIKS